MAADTSHLTRLETLAQDVCLQVTGEPYARLADEPLWGGRLESIVAVELVAAILEVADVTFSADELSDVRTLRALVRQAHEKRTPSAAADDSGFVFPLANRRGYFLRRREALEQWISRTPLLRPRQRLDLDRFESAVLALVARHEGLRLQVEWRGYDLTETVVPASRLTPIEVVRLPRTRSEEEYLESALSATSEIARAFAFPGELFKVVVLQAQDRPDTVVVIEHHLLVDAISLAVMWSELQQLYLTDDPLLPATASLRKFSKESRRYRAARANHDLSYWDSMPWSEAEPLFRQSEDRSDSAFGTEWSTRRVERVLGSWSQTRGGDGGGFATGAATSFNLAETVLTAFAMAFCSCTGCPLLQIDLVVHGRGGVVPGVSLARTVGYLSETVPLLVRPDPTRDGRAALHQQLVHAVTNGASYGFLRYLSAPGIIERTRAWPLSELSFNVVLPGLRRPVLSDFATVAGPPFALERENDAHRVYAASAGLYVRGDDLVLSWDWGDAVDGDFMRRFLDGCREWYQLLRDEERA